MGGCLSSTRITGSNSFSRRKKSGAGNLVIRNNRKEPTNPVSNTQAPAITQRNHRKTSHQGGTKRSEIVPCGKRTDFGYAKDFDCKFTIGKLLGHGQFGYTYVATDKSTGERVAVKKIDKNKMVLQIAVEDVKREVKILQELTGHENVVQFYDAFEDENYVYIAMELCEGGELLDRILAKKDSRYTEKDAAVIVRQMLKVAAECHLHGLVHRDMKPENFLFKSSKTDSSLKATDFGLSDFIKPGKRFTDIVGSAYYVAPEVLKRKSGPESDAWSIGVITYILLCGRRPFWDKTENGIFKEVLRNKPDFRRKPWPTISNSAKDFVKKLLVKDPRARLTAAQALSHPWVREGGSASDIPVDISVLHNMRQFVKYSRMKQFALRALASTINEEELACLRDQFDAIDVDKNGVISLEEMRQALAKDLPWKLKDSRVQEIVQAIDSNTDGLVDFTEFVAATLHVHQLEEHDSAKWQQLSQAAFDKFDVDRDGFITPEELRLHTGLKGSVDPLLEDADIDKDGKISLPEFRTLLRNASMRSRNTHIAVLLLLLLPVAVLQILVRCVLLPPSSVAVFSRRRPLPLPVAVLQILVRCVLLPPSSIAVFSRRRPPPLPVAVLHILVRCVLLPPSSVGVFSAPHLMDSQENLDLQAQKFFASAPPLKDCPNLAEGLRVLHLVGQLYLWSNDVFDILITLARVTEEQHQQSTFLRLDMRGTCQPYCRALPDDPLLECFGSVDNSDIQVAPSYSAAVSSAIGNHHAAVKGGLLLKIPFNTIFEYLQILQIIAFSVQSVGPRAMFYLAAAVSDFYVPWESMTEHKIQSASGPLDMRLAQVPKMLTLLRRDWAPSSFCISFKLETDSEILIEKASIALNKYKMHAVVANELSSRKEEVTVVSHDGNIRIQRDKNKVGSDVESPLIELIVARHASYIQGLDGVHRESIATNSSMEIQNLLCFFLLLLFLSIPTRADVDEYFLDCGSSSNTAVDDGRNFTGDSTVSTGVKLLGKNRRLAKDTGNQSELYRTAVIFNSPGGYEFTISETGTYILRLHFYAFSSSSALMAAQFNVSASWHLLLSNFSGKSSLNSLIIKEFLLTVSSGEFTVFFVPNSSSVVAFVNAIELLNAKTKIGTPVVISSGLQTNLKTTVLMPVHRINVGGQLVSPASDSRWRTWLPDDSYLVTKTAAKNGAIRSSRPEYQEGNATYFDAPDRVYDTAKELNLNSNSDPINATWSFNVSRNSIFFVRVHFCDIISEGVGVIVFNLYINKDFGWGVDSLKSVNAMAAPFYFDFLLKSDELGFVNISIGSRNGTDFNTKNAFLNGLELMEVISGSVAEPDISADSNGKKVGLIVGVIVGAVGLIGVILAACFWRWKKATEVKDEQAESFNWPLVRFNGGGSSENNVTERTASNGSAIPSLHLKLKIPFSEIQQITNNFDVSLVVGEGGFGKVYKGVLKNGTNVAVKRSDSRHGQGFPEFLAEITVLTKIRHRHLVQLIGYCDDNNEMVLVYEFMENGTLRDHLYNNDSSVSIESLSWKARLEICIGAAKGLHYLHTGLVGVIVHRDVKSSNILLDANYEAKVSDFGLSRSDPQDCVSIDVKGTFGYLDPEYCRCFQLTEKSDVYSFGVVLLEVLCARKVINRSLSNEHANLADWALARKAREGIEAIVDPTLAGQINPNSLAKFVETAEKCLRESGVDRPAMSDVVWDLQFALHLHKHYASQAESMNMSTMLDIPSFTTNNVFPFSIGDSITGMSGVYGAYGEDSIEVGTKM
ncbi:hypothetical protein V2J09_021820 [Rumex salicifolius]